LLLHLFSFTFVFFARNSKGHLANLNDSEVMAFQQSVN